METSESALLLNLPEDVIIRILSYLSVPDLVLGVRPTCRYLRGLSQMPDLWKQVTLAVRQPGPTRPSCPEEFFFKGMLHQKCVAPVTREREADESSRGQGDRCVMQREVTSSEQGDIARCVLQREVFSSGQGDAPRGVLQREVTSSGQGDAARGVLQMEVEDSPGHWCSHSVDAGGISMMYVEKEVMAVATSVEERGDLPSMCSITGGVFYPNVKKVALLVDTLPSTCFLSNYRDLRHLRIEKAANGRLPPCVSIPDKNECQGFFTACFKNLVHCKTLEAFELIGHFPVEKPSHDITIRSAIIEYFRSGSELRRLQLDISLTDDMVRTILDHCSELQDLQLSNTNLTVKPFGNVLRTPNRSLSALRLKGCQLQDDKVVHAISEGFINMKILELTIDDVQCRKCFQLLLSGFPELTVLKLTVVNEIFLEAKRLSIKVDCNDQDDKREKDEFPREVDCSTLPSRTEEGRLQQLEVHVDGAFEIDSSMLEEAFCRQRALRSFKLTQCSGGDACLQVRTERGLLPQSVSPVHKGCCVPASTVALLIKMHPYLESIECPLGFSAISSSQGAFERDLSPDSRLQRDPTDSRLWCLSLHSWCDVSARELWALTSWCPGLTSLTITDVGRVSDSCVEAILRNCPRLQHLKLVSCSKGYRLGRLSGKSGRHVQTWGRCLRSVVWMVNTALFGYADLARTVVHSSALSLEDFTLSDRGRRRRRVITDVMTREMGRLGEEQGKRVITAQRVRLKVDGCFSEEQDALHFHVQNLARTSAAAAQSRLQWAS